jgi:hypothetical protein
MFFIPALNYYFSSNIGSPTLHMLDVIGWAALPCARRYQGDSQLRCAWDPWNAANVHSLHAFMKGYAAQRPSPA